MLMARLMVRTLPGPVLMLTLVMPCLFWGTECEKIKTIRALARSERPNFLMVATEKATRARVSSINYNI